VDSSEGQIVLFIDEIHTVVGAGCPGPRWDASKPSQSRCWVRGELRMHACLPPSIEHASTFEKDSGPANAACQQVFVGSAARGWKDTISILRGPFKEALEGHQRYVTHRD